MLRIAGALSVVIGLAAAPGAQAPAGPAPSAPIETKHLEIRTSWNAEKRGAISLVVDVTPKPAMHVYAPGEKDAIPVSLTLAPGDAFKSAEPKFPRAEKYYFEPLKLTQLVYAKPFQIAQPVTITAARVSGPTLEIKGTLRYQACDDKVCYLPQSVPLSWELPVR